MADPFIAEIRIIPFTFAPRDWAHCNGQIMPIRQNTALFSLIGTFYGGDGRSNFGLPNLQGRAPIQAGQSPGFSSYDLGEMGGSVAVELNQNQIPIHNHELGVNSQAAESSSPAGNSIAVADNAVFLDNATTNATLHSTTIQPQTGGLVQPHNNMMPYLVTNFCIALSGVFPPRP